MQRLPKCPARRMALRRKSGRKRSNEYVLSAYSKIAYSKCSLVGKFSRTLRLKYKWQRFLLPDMPPDHPKRCEAASPQYRRRCSNGLLQPRVSCMHGLTSDTWSSVLQNLLQSLQFSRVNEKFSLFLLRGALRQRQQRGLFVGGNLVHHRAQAGVQRCAHLRPLQA